MLKFLLAKGPAKNKFLKLKKNRILKYSRVNTVVQSLAPKRLILGIGQIHPVLTGRFSWLSARHIADTQAWIFNLCRHLNLHLKVTSFGQEGFSTADGNTTRARLGRPLLTTLKNQLKKSGDPKAAKKILREVANNWRQALKFGNRDEATKNVTALNALSILQALESKVTIFPIEQRDVHSTISQGLDQLQLTMSQIESSPAYRAGAAKGGKNLNKNEYSALKARNQVVAQFNKLIKHPERDRSILREIMEQAEGKSVTVFILGQGHHRGFLRIYKRHAPKDTLLIWVTPPSLWWWKAFWNRSLVIGSLVAIGLISLYLINI